MAPAQQQASPAASWDHPIQLHVQVLGASAAAGGELISKLAGPDANDSFRVAAFRPDTDAGELVRKLGQKQEVEIVSAWWLMAGVGRAVRFRAARPPYQLRLRLCPETHAGRVPSSRVRPAI